MIKNIKESVDELHSGRQSALSDSSYDIKINQVMHFNYVQKLIASTHGILTKQNLDAHRTVLHSVLYLIFQEQKMIVL